MQGAQAQFGRGVFSALRVRGLDGGQAARLRGVSPPFTAEFSWLPQHFLNFEPEPQGQGAFRGVFEPITWSRLRICGAGWAVLQNEPASGLGDFSDLQNEPASGFEEGTIENPPRTQAKADVLDGRKRGLVNIDAEQGEVPGQPA